jgi:excisionase family DNA binding protein
VTVQEHTVLPPSETATELTEALRELEERLKGSSAAMMVIEVEGERLAVPDMLLPLVSEAIASLAKGKAVRIEPTELMLSTQQAADILGMSRPTLVRLLGADAIPFTTPTGTHRRVKLVDVLAYRDNSEARRSNGLARMMDQPAAEDYESVVGFGPRRE